MKDTAQIPEPTESQALPVLEYLQRLVDGTLQPGHTTHLRYPTAISRTLGMRLAAVSEGCATLELEADAAAHGNQQGTVHGGLLGELADAAIGTAHSTRLAPGESFASIELKVMFLRPVWKSLLRAVARPIHAGQTISHYQCDIHRDDDKLVATAVSAVMTLRGEQAAGR
jgi:uncharacterized protein (TIGR00369 family)